MKRILSFILLFVSVPVITNATSIGDITVGDVRLSQKKSEVQVAFSLSNTSGNSQVVTYGLRLQEKKGAEIFEIPIDTVTLAPSESAVHYAKKDFPQLAGAYDVFIVSRNKTGALLILKYAGEVAFPTYYDKKKQTTTAPLTEAGQDKVKSASLARTPRLSDCEVDMEKATIACSVLNAGSAGEVPLTLHYAIYEGSVYTPPRFSGVLSDILPKDGVVYVTLSSMAKTLPGGTYTFELWLNDKLYAQRVIVQVDEKHTEESSNSLQKEVASSVANTQSPFILIQSKIKNILANPMLVFSVPILLLLLFLYIALRRPKAGAMIVIAGVALSLSGAVAYAAMQLTDNDASPNIFNGLSRDSEKVQFIVTLDASSFKTTDPIGMTIAFQETALPNRKPAGGVLEMNIDGGAWNTVISADSPQSIVYTTIPAITSPGIHTLNFRSPDLCGSAFGKSLFGFAFFGATDCLFSLQVTIVQNEPPTTPNIGGNCFLGIPCNIGIVSTDTDGGQLCYEAQLPNGLRVDAGCATEGNPVFVQYTFTSCNAADTIVYAQATDSGGLQSAWGVGSADIEDTISCTVSCPHCTYNGTQGDIAITALPAFLPPNGVVNVRWSLTNVATCSVTGTNLSSGDQVDYWDWDIVRVNDSRQSSLLSGPTKYTLTCTDLNGQNLTDEVIISTVPNWQEL